MTTADEKSFTLDRIVRLIISLALLWGIIRLLDYLSDVLIPFAVALLMAYLINPLVSVIQKKIPGRPAAVFISLLVVIILATSFVLVTVPLVADEFGEMGRLLKKVVTDTELANRAATYLPDNIWQTIKEYAARPEIQDLFKSEKFWNVGRAAAGKLLPGAWGLISGTASLLLGIIGLAIIGLYLIFLLLDYQAISRGWKELIPPAYRESVTGFVADFEAAMSAYFRGQAAVAAICGLLFAVGFAIVGLPLGILLGLFVGLLNMVPYLQILGLIPAFLFALFHALDAGTSLWLVLGLTGLVFVVVQVVQDVVLVPKIMGKVTGLNPAMIMLSLSIWGKLLGLLGLIVALPMTYLLLVYYRRFLAGAQPVS